MAKEAIKLSGSEELKQLEEKKLPFCIYFFMVVLLLLIFFLLCRLNSRERDGVEGGDWAATDGEITGLLGQHSPPLPLPAI